MPSTWKKNNMDEISNRIELRNTILNHYERLDQEAIFFCCNRMLEHHSSLDSRVTMLLVWFYLFTQVFRGILSVIWAAGVCYTYLH